MYNWLKELYDEYTDSYVQEDDFPNTLKKSEFCFDWKTMCWTILRLCDIGLYLAESWEYLALMLVMVLIFIFAWVRYLRKMNTESLRIRVFNLNRDLLNLNVKVLQLKSMQRVFRALGARRYIIETDSENNSENNTENSSEKNSENDEPMEPNYEKLGEEAAAKLSRPISDFLNMYLTCEDKERRLFLEAWSNLVSQEKKKLANKLNLKRVSSEVALPTHLNSRTTQELLLSTQFVSRRPTPIQHAPMEMPMPMPEPIPERVEEAVPTTEPLSLQDRCRSKSMVQPKSITKRSPYTRNRRGKRLGVNPNENIYKQSRMYDGRFLDEVPERNIYEFKNQDYVQSNFYVPPLLPYQLHELKKKQMAKNKAEKAKQEADKRNNKKNKGRNQRRPRPQPQAGQNPRWNY